MDRTSRESGPELDRDQLISRYLTLRRISLEHHRAATKFASPAALLDRAKRVVLGDGRGVGEVNYGEHAVLTDLIIYSSLHGRSRPIDRFAKAARFAPGSDEALVLSAMRRARFSVWEVRRRHPTAGLILYDLQRLAET